MTSPLTPLPSRLRWILIFWMFLVSAIAYMDRVNISISGQAIAREFHLGDYQLGAVFSAFVFGYALFQAPGGWVADRLGPRIPLAVGFILLSLTLFGVGHTDSFREILPLVIVASLSYAVVLPAWNLLLSRNMPSGNEGSFWGIFMAIEGLGLSIGSLFGGRLWDQFGPRAPFELSAAILGVMALFYLFYPIHHLTLTEATSPPEA